MRTIDRNYLIALTLFGNGGSSKFTIDSGRQSLIDAVDAKLAEWNLTPSTAIGRKPEYESLATMSMSFSTGVKVIRSVRHPSEFPEPTKPTKASAELLQRYESRLKGWESMRANAQTDVEFIRSLAATLGLSGVSPVAELASNDPPPPTLESVVGRSNAVMLADHPGPNLDTVQAVRDAVASGFDLTKVDGIGPKKAAQIKELIGL